MTKYSYLFFCFLSLFIAKNVNALECYVTDQAALRSQGASAVPIPKNCRTYYNELGLGHLVGNDFRCTTVTAEAAEARIFVQGCLTAADTCDQLKDQLKSFEHVSPLSFNKVTCKVCDTNFCNSGVTRSIELKIRRGSGLTPRYAFAIGLFSALGLIALILAVVYFCLRKKTSAVYKV